MAKGKKTGGRVKGSVNIFTKSVREVINDAFREMQLKPGVNMLEWGQSNQPNSTALHPNLYPCR